MKKLLCLLFIIAFILCGCNQQDTVIVPSGKTVKIGVIAPMSGPDKNSGENAILGIRTALKMQPYLNNGDSVELVVEDNQGTPQHTLKALAKLQDQEDVSGVLLMAKSDSVLAVVPVADQYKIPILALIATHPEVTKNNRFISQLGFDDIFQGKVAALYVRDEMLINRVAVISDPENAHYSYLATEFINRFTEVGGELVEHISRDPAGKYLEVGNELKEKETQLVYLAVPPEQVIQFSTEVDKIGWKPLLMGTDGLLSAIILKHSENIGLVNGMIATDFYSTMLPRTKYGRKAAQIFKKSFSASTTTYTGLGCEGTSILLHAIDRCENKSSRSCVNYMLRHTQGFEGLYGRINIHEDGKAERPIFVNDIVNQKMNFLVKVY